MHHECGIYHFIARGQVEPDLKELGRVRLVGVDERKHFAVHNALAGSHPLEIPVDMKTQEHEAETQYNGVVDHKAWGAPADHPVRSVPRNRQSLCDR